VPAPRAVVFDLDGTLIDSLRDIATAINRMRADLDLAPLSVGAVGGMVGEGARRLVRRALPEGTDKDGLHAALERYLAHYGEVCLDTTTAYPGMAATLAALAPSYPLAVLTNKGEAISRRILEGLGLLRFLREVVGGDTLPTRKPNPGGLFLLADRLGLAADRLLLVGDSRIDALTAGAARCPFGLAEWGGMAPTPTVEDAKEKEEDGEPAPPQGSRAGEAEAVPTWRFAQPRDLLAAFDITDGGADAADAADASDGEDATPAS
jgi:phosphoglycolate phosphatase